MWFWGRCFWETFQTKIKKILGERGAMLVLPCISGTREVETLWVPCWLKKDQLFWILIFFCLDHIILYTSIISKHLISYAIHRHASAEMKHVVWSQPAAGCKKLGGSNWQGIMTASRCNCEKSRRRGFLPRNWGRKFWTWHIWSLFSIVGVGSPFRQKDWSSQFFWKMYAWCSTYGRTENKLNLRFLFDF